MKRTNATAALVVVVAATSAYAETYTYTCKANHKTYPAKLDIDNGTLTCWPIKIRSSSVPISARLSCTPPWTVETAGSVITVRAGRLHLRSA
jgi:hypothetical protein